MKKDMAIPRNHDDASSSATGWSCTRHTAWTTLACQPKSREQSSHSRKHVTFSLTVNKSVYPARTPELDGNGKWILMDFSRLRSGRLSGKKKPTQQLRGTDL